MLKVPQVSYTPVAVPVVYGQQQNPPVTSFSSAFQCDVPSATKGSDKVLVLNCVQYEYHIFVTDAYHNII